MHALLHNMQTRSSGDFAWHALAGYIGACDARDMQIRLREFRDRLGMTLEDMAERSGYSVSQLSRWEQGKSNIPSERLTQLAKSYKCSVGDIFAEDIPGVMALGPTLYVIGTVQAGAWKDVWELPEEEWQPFTGRRDVTAPLRDRFGLRVVGESMNDIYPNGTIVECVSFLAGAEIENGRRVVVQRRRADLEYEITVKEYRRGPDGIEWLLPRSNHPDFQTPYRVGELEPGITDVQIIGLVVASVRLE